MRSFRFEFWPDKRNVTGKQLRKLIAAADLRALEQENFRTVSVAVQGLSAMERLLFVPEYLDLRRSGNTFVCALLRAISGNLRAMAGETYAAWNEGDGRYSAIMAVGPAGNAAYFDAQEATADLLLSVVSMVEFVADRKLARPMGASLERAKPRRAESWRSQRSLRNIGRNMAAVEALYSGDGGVAHLLTARDETLHGEIQASFRHIQALLAVIPDPLADAVGDPDLRPLLDELVVALRELRRIMTHKLAPALDLSIGFNSLDGD